MRSNIRNASYVFAAASVLLRGACLGAQSPLDTLRTIAALDRIAVRESEVLERSIWPGYRFDSLGLMYIVPGVGKLAVRWPGPPPAGMRPMPGAASAWWADTGAVRWGPGLAAATLSVAAEAPRAEVLGLALHEAFHAYQVTQRQPGRPFGRGENSLLTPEYPVFDAENEAAFAAESRLLRQAVEAPSDAESRRLAAAFLAVRQHRQARLDTAFAAYEKAAELHEGLPQYALLRGLETIAARHPEFREGAATERSREAAVLDSTLAPGQRSVRRRFYATGSHLALLLDRLSDDAWKHRVVREDRWLQELLAEAVRPDTDTAATRAHIEARLPAAVRATANLRARRIAQRDSLLSQPGTRLIVDISSDQASPCLFDPQNVLSTGVGQSLHTRVLRVCMGDAMTASFARPVVEDSWSHTVTTVVAGAVEIVAAGRAVAPPAPGTALILNDIRVEGEGVEIVIVKAVVVGGASRLLVIPLAP